MADILPVILPVFILIGAGYLVARLSWMSAQVVDALMVFTQRFAIPCLLFRGIATVDLGVAFRPGLLLSFYSAALICFVLGCVLAAKLFGHRPGVAVAIGFCALFSNSALLGLPITERAYGADALASNFAILSMHAPFLYFIGISTMEYFRADGRGLLSTLKTIGREMSRNTLMMGVFLGLLMNFSGLPFDSGPLRDTVDLMANAALPVALFGLGGVLVRYGMSRDNLPEVLMICLLSLIVHPGIAYLLGAHLFHITQAEMRSAVITAAMAPGINVYIFANIYDRAKATAAASVLIGTALTLVTASLWIIFIG